MAFQGELNLNSGDNVNLMAARDVDNKSVSEILLSDAVKADISTAGDKAVISEVRGIRSDDVSLIKQISDAQFAATLIAMSHANVEQRLAAI